MSLLLHNLYVVLFAVAICTWLFKMRRDRAAGKRPHWAYVLWGELLFYSVGLNFAYTGIFHAYFQGLVAPLIGWQPSPFEFELGWGEIGLAAIALLSLRRGYEFRLATTVVFCIFSIAAAAQHIAQIVCCRNLAPDNAGLVLWFGDVALPVAILALALLARGERET